MCLLSPFFYFFFSSRTFQQHHLLFSSEKSERQRERRKTRGSVFTMPSEIEVHHVVEDRRSPCTTTSAVPPSLVLLPPSGWVRSTCSFLFLFFIFACSDSTLFYKNWNFFCVLCLDYVRNGVRSACSFFFSFFFFFIFACSDSTLF